MDKESKPQLKYVEGATDEWVNEVADKIVEKIDDIVKSGKYYDLYLEQNIKFSEKDQALLHSNDFLKRAVRGFVVEFVRQSRDAVSVNKLPYTPEAREEVNPGLFQATATVDWLVKNKMDQSNALAVLKMIITNAAIIFPGEYEQIDNENTPRAQIRRATDEVIDRVEKAELRRAAKARSQTPIGK